MHEKLPKVCVQHAAGSIPVGRHGALRFTGESGCALIPKKPAPDLIRGVQRFPACAKPLRDPVAWIDAWTGAGRQDSCSSKTLEWDDNSKKSHPAAARGLINRERSRYA